VGVEIVPHQHDLRRVGKMHVRQVPEHIGIIDAAAIRLSLQPSPSSEQAVPERVGGRLPRLRFACKRDGARSLGRALAGRSPGASGVKFRRGTRLDKSRASSVALWHVLTHNMVCTWRVMPHKPDLDVSPELSADTAARGSAFRSLLSGYPPD
jgi:hypothetical protein